MTSEEERVALAQGGMEAFNDGDMERVLVFLADDVEVFASPKMVNAGRFTGHEGFASWIEAWTDAWEQLSTEVTAATPVGQRHVVTAIYQEGRGRGGIEVSMDLAFLFDVNDEGQCVFLAMLPTREEAVALAEERESA
jgi:ketosteroid isomerase-like protein